jgi:hypothetical protein
MWRNIYWSIRFLIAQLLASDWVEVTCPSRWRKDGSLWWPWGDEDLDNPKKPEWDKVYEECPKICGTKFIVRRNEGFTCPNCKVWSSPCYHHTLGIEVRRK